ncbi:MAG: hypothetical protein R2865_12590 [Deinococcales bacterium]
MIKGVICPAKPLAEVKKFSQRCWAYCGLGLWSPSIVFTHGPRGEDSCDADGNEYLDCMAGIGVASVGHGNDYLAEA